MTIGSGSGGNVGIGSGISAGISAGNGAPGGAGRPPPDRAERPRLVVLISGRGSNLRSLVQAIDDGRIAAEVAGVVSNRPDAAGLQWAAARGLPVRALDHRGHGDRAAFDTALAATVESLAQTSGCWVVLAGFMRILGDAFIDRFAGRIVNVHPSLLPAYPGLHTHRRALEDGALLHGATIHLVTPALDHGPILAQALVPVLAGDDEPALAARVLAMEHALYPMALSWLVDGRIRVAGGRVRLDGDDAPVARVLLDPLFSRPPHAAASPPPVG